MIFPLVPNLQTFAAALAFGVAAGGLAGWSIHGWFDDSKQLENARQLQQQLLQEQERGNQIAEGWAAAAEVLRKQQREHVRTVTQEVSHPEYRDCTLPDSGRMLLNSAIDAANAANHVGSIVSGTAENIR